MTLEEEELLLIGTVHFVGRSPEFTNDPVADEQEQVEYAFVQMTLPDEELAGILPHA